MKHKPKLRGVNAPETASLMTTSSSAAVHVDALPPPDPTTRADVDLVPGAPSPPTPARRRDGKLIVVVGLVGILVAVASGVVKLFELPSLSVLAVAALGAGLVLIGALRLHSGSVRSRPAAEVIDAAAQQPISQRLVAVDLPSMTGQLGGVLAQLRQQYGMAYRTRTWIEDVLPAHGDDLKNPALARDLLAVAALDAGGIRADVSSFAESHARDDIVETGGALLAALQHVLTACEDSTDHSAQRPSDPSCWPASTW